ncbi:hypothetical protein HAX54_019364, partial [Datura stramonium]|nr:hypothetical protein [Datura stramonium]
EAKVMEDFNSKRAAKDMLLTGDMRICTCEMPVKRSCYCLETSLNRHLEDWHQLNAGEMQLGTGEM